MYHMVLKEIVRDKRKISKEKWVRRGLIESSFILIPLQDDYFDFFTDAQNLVV